jgi:hypothetical protein
MIYAELIKANSYVGIMIAVRLPQPEKILADIWVSDVGRFTLFRAAAFANAD